MKASITVLLKHHYVADTSLYLFNCFLKVSMNENMLYCFEVLMQNQENIF